MLYAMCSLVEGPHGVQHDFGSQAPFLLAGFAVHRGRRGWQISPSGYVRWPESLWTGAAQTVVVAARVGR